MTKLPLTHLRIVVVVVLLQPISVISQSINSQRSILFSIKNQWGGDLPAFSSWNHTTSPCTWEGIHCTSDGTVIGISLPNTNISTEIPTSVCELKNLTTLDLNWNNIPNGFPKVLYRCSALTYLNLSYNLFVGPIPDDVNKLSPFLQHLDLTGNNFTGDVPESIGGFKELRTLYLTNNLLDGTFPAQIGNLSKLEDLQMASNPFTPMALPCDWGTLNNLKYLFMKECNLVGEIPESFGGLESLEHLDLVGNQLVGSIPNALFSLKDMSVLYLDENNLSGSIPTSIQSLNLTEIDLSQNQLNGSIPEEFGKLKSLQVLYLFDNKLSGEIPRSLENCTTLRQLMLKRNNFTGEILRFKTTQLQYLSMAGNRLQGSIPNELCQSTSLYFVDLSTNQLEGEIPSCFSNLSGLSFLMLKNNRFSGRLSYPFSNMSQLKILDLSYNRLAGGITSWIDQLLSLQVLLLGGNSLKGRLPIQLCHLWQLNVMDLSSNGIYGQVPACFNNMSFGTYVTDFVYHLDQQLCIETKGRRYCYTSLAFEYMSGLDLSCNQLTGHIPPELGGLKGVHNLNLSHNRLSGPIPMSFSKLRNIESLDLSYNNLSGAIPTQLAALNFLEIFNVSYNNLSGKPPMSGQFATFDVNSYRGNPLLWGYTQEKSSSVTLLITPSSNQENQTKDDKFDWEVLLWSFGMSCAVSFIGSNVLLYINPHWRHALFVIFDYHILWRLHQSY